MRARGVAERPHVVHAHTGSGERRSPRARAAAARRARRIGLDPAAPLIGGDSDQRRVAERLTGDLGAGEHGVLRRPLRTPQLKALRVGLVGHPSRPGDQIDDALRARLHGIRPREGDLARHDHPALRLEAGSLPHVYGVQVEQREVGASRSRRPRPRIPGVEHERAVESHREGPGDRVAARLSDADSRDVGGAEVRARAEPSRPEDEIAHRHPVDVRVHAGLPDPASDRDGPLLPEVAAREHVDLVEGLDRRIGLRRPGRVALQCDVYHAPRVVVLQPLDLGPALERVR